MEPVEIINKICETLDFDLLKFVKPSIVRKIKELILSQDEKKVKYKAFFTLAKNYFLNKESERKIGKPLFVYPKYILGPYTLTKLVSPLYSQILYVFGEYHTFYSEKITKCKIRKGEQSMRPSTFFKNLAMCTSKPIDFYFETTAKNKMNVPHIMRSGELTMDLDNLDREFDYCITPNPDRAKCEYPSSRFHYIDLRRMAEGINIGIILIYSDHPRDLWIHYNYELNMMKVFSGYAPFLKKKGWCTRSDLEKFFSQTPVFLKIQKQYKNTIIDLEIAKKLYDGVLYNSAELTKQLELDLMRYKIVFMTQNERKTYSNSNAILVLNILYKKIIGLTKDEQKQKEGEMMNLSKRITKYYLDTNTLIIDLYTIFRMFRIYRKIPFSNSIIPRNIIYYGGDSHSNNIRFLLQTYLGYTITSFPTGDIISPVVEYQKCIDISSLNNNMF